MTPGTPPALLQFNRRQSLQMAALVSLLPAGSRAAHGFAGGFWDALSATVLDLHEQPEKVHSVAGAVADIIATTEPDELRSDLLSAVELLRWWGLLQLQFYPFEQQSPEVRYQLVNGWFSSRLAVVRTAGTVVRGLVVFAWYDRCESWAELGYEGPLVRFPGDCGVALAEPRP